MTGDHGVMAPSLQTHSQARAAPVFRGEPGLTPKAFVIAMLLIPLNVFWIIQLEVVRYTHPTLIHPLSNVIFIIFWLMVFSAVLGKLSNALRLTPAELLTIYVMLCIVSSLCSHDMMEIFDHDTRTPVSVRYIRE